MLVAAASEAAYFVLQQRYLAVYRPLVVAASTTWAATALLLPAAPAAAVQLGRAAPQATAAMVFLGVFPTAGAYLAWSYVLARQSAVHTTSSLYVLPVLAIVIAWAWLGEVPQPLALIGGGLALLGVGIAQALR